MYFSFIQLYLMVLVSGSIAKPNTLFRCIDTMPRYVDCVGNFNLHNNAVLSKDTKNRLQSYKRCKLSHPAINTCLKNALTEALPFIAKGVPSLNLFPFDPIKISSIEIKQDNSHTVQINLKVKDVQAKNLFSKTEITDFKTDIKNLNASISLLIKDPLLLEGLYDISGKVLILPIVGNGPFHMKLGDNMNVFLNENWPDILKDFQPALEQALVFVLIEYTNQFFGRVSMEDLFIE